MKSSVIVFPGSNCDRDVAVALEKMQFKNQMVWHKETKLPKSDLIVVPGGFSYGDYLRSGAIAGKSLIIDEVIKAANSGCLILGICNGFQILTETNLLPGTLIRNKELSFICKNLPIKVENSNSSFTHNYLDNEIIKIPVAHNEGNFFADREIINNIKDKDLIVFKYCDKFGNTDDESNPNGSLDNPAKCITQSIGCVEKISLSSILYKNLSLISEIASSIGSQSVVATIDLLRKNSIFKTTYQCRTRNMLDLEDVDAFNFIKLCEDEGVGEIVINSIDRDGEMKGYDINLADKINNMINIPLTILGGAGSHEDMKELIAKCGIIGSAAGSLFVFKGKYRAVLINYPSNEKKQVICSL